MEGSPVNELFLSYEPDYFCIEDILATEIKISCKTNVPLIGFGFLDPSLEETDLPKASNLELPVWAAQFMVKPDRNYMSAEVPSKYKKSYRDIVKAEPSIIDLNKWGPHYYQAGIHIVCLPIEDAKAIGEILIFLLQKRLVKLSHTYSYTTKLYAVDETTRYYQRVNVLREHYMDSLELRIYKDAQKGVIGIQTWMEAPSRPLL